MITYKTSDILKTRISRSVYFTTFCWMILMINANGIAHADPEVRIKKWNEYQYGENTLGFHGYLRTSYGVDTEGGKVMPTFIAPGAQSKFRLGNESDTNIELTLDYKHFLEGIDSENGRYIQLLGMISDYDTNPNYNDVKIELKEKSNPQSFIRLGNFLGDGVNLWLGKRYYDRRDIHMNDHFWLNVAQGAQFGGGIEGIHAGIGTLDIAGFKNQDSSVSDRLGLSTETENLNSYSLDMRYRGIPTNKDGDITLWGLYSYRPEVSDINFDRQDGFGLGGWHTQKNILSGRMVTGMAYRRGTALQQGLFNSKSVREDQGYDLDNAYSMELNNDLLIEPNRDFAMQWATVLRHEKRGVDGSAGDRIDWASTGVRPVFFLTDNVSIATELGADYVNDEITGQEGILGKGTLALQLTQGRGYFERPVIRVFTTAAKWSNDFKGSVGNGSPEKADNYADNTSGLTFGIQFESWW